MQHGAVDTGPEAQPKLVGIESLGTPSRSVKAHFAIWASTAIFVGGWDLAAEVLVGG
jgi:hypothetical protein